MSALPPIATIERTCQEVRLVPIATSSDLAAHESLVLSLVHGTNQYERNYNGYQAIFNDHHRGLVGKESSNGFHGGSVTMKN
jgi:hypothetical protein